MMHVRTKQVQVLVAHSRALTGTGMDGNIEISYILYIQTTYTYPAVHIPLVSRGDRVIVRWRKVLGNPILNTGLWYFMGGHMGGGEERETSADEKTQFRRHFAVYLHEILVE